MRYLTQGWLAILWLTLAGCGGDAVVAAPSNTADVDVSEAVISDFQSRTGAINAGREKGNTPAAALTAGGEGETQVGVILWHPEKTGRAIGFKDGDKVVAIDDTSVESVFADKWDGFGKHKRVKAFAADKYTNFVNNVFRERYDESEVLVTLYRRSGRSWAPEPVGIRIKFE